MNKIQLIKKVTLKFLGVLFLLCFLHFNSSAQKKDSIEIALTGTDSLLNSHSPMKASIMSAIVPGLGQVYNSKKGKPNYLKIPIIYAGLGTGIYFIQSNYSTYITAKQVYLDRQDGVEPSTHEYDYVSDAQLIDEVETYRRYTELAVIGSIAVYLLNIIDASVYAHLYHFDVSDDLSFNFQPNIFPSVASNNTFVGGTIQFQF